MESEETGMIRGCSDQLCQGKPGTTLQKKCHLDKDLKNDGSLLGREWVGVRYLGVWWLGSTLDF